MKKILILIIVVGILAAGILISNRYQIENQNRTVELVMDYSLLEEFNQVKLLPQLDKLGLTSVAMEEESLRALEENNQISYFEGKELDLLSELFSEVPAQINRNGLYIKGKIELLIEIKRVLERKLTKSKIKLEDELLIISNWDSKLLDVPLYFSPQVINSISSLDLDLIPRISTQESVYDLRRLISTLPQVNQIIFSGNKVVGYPNKISLTAQILKAAEIKLGMIEPFIAYQQGINQLASRMQLKAVRVHSLQQKELTKLGVERTVSRYLRAVRERNVRTLYLKPFSKKEDTLNFISRLANELKVQGYKLGVARPFNKIPTSQYLKFMIMLVILLPVSLIFNLTSKSLGYLVLSSGGLLLLGLYILSDRLILEVLALWAAIIFPVISFWYLTKKIQGEGSLRRAYKLFWQASLITCTGGVLLVALLSDRRYLLQINHFRGVKLAFIIPLILSAIYYLYIRYDSWQKVKSYLSLLLNNSLIWKDVLVLIIILLGGIIYLSRTGNAPVIPVISFEMKIREMLESLLIVRPRFKSFLIGHPLLILGISFSFKDRGYLWLIVLGLIGQINILNTFSHLHTPIIISSIRVLIGLILGSLIGGGIVYSIQLIVGKVRSEK